MGIRHVDVHALAGLPCKFGRCRHEIGRRKCHTRKLFTLHRLCQLLRIRKGRTDLHKRKTGSPPSERFVPSNRHSPGYSRAASKVGSPMEGGIQHLPVSGKSIARCQPSTGTTVSFTVSPSLSTAIRANSPIVSP